MRNLMWEFDHTTCFRLVHLFVWGSVCPHGELNPREMNKIELSHRKGFLRNVDPAASLCCCLWNSGVLEL